MRLQPPFSTQGYDTCMGLDVSMIEAVFRENAHHPIDGDVLLMGRQTVYLSPSDTLELMRKSGLEPQLRPEQIVLDMQAHDRDAKQMERQGALISDRSVFRLLGSKSVRALAHSDYEGAEVIHDLTQPLPDSLRGIADFVLDGGTLDNKFSPAATIRNYAELLRPGGRLLIANMLTNHHEPYSMMPPQWYLDYFTMNGFADCKVYIGLTRSGAFNAFCIDLDCLMTSGCRVSRIESPDNVGVVVFAEKGAASTSHVCPSHEQYRSKAEWEVYRRNLALIMTNTRPHLIRSRGRMFYSTSRSGLLFMDEHFEAIDPILAATRERARDRR